MSLITCVSGETIITMQNSDCEDQLAKITQRLKSVTDQGSELGKYLSNLDSKIDNVTQAYRQLSGYESSMMFSQSPNAQQGIAMARQRKAILAQQDARLRAQRNQMESEKMMLANQEKQLLAEKTYWDTMYKFSQGAMQKFKQMKDGAIQRFFGGQ